jgi:hypothetical protein
MQEFFFVEQPNKKTGVNQDAIMRHSPSGFSAIRPHQSHLPNY